MGNIFGEKNQPAPQPAPKDYTPELAGIQTQIGALSAFLSLEALKKEKQGAPVTYELMTLGAPYTVELYGYKYLGIIVSGPVTLHVEQSNIKYDVALTAGFNQVRLFNGANISTDAGTPCVLVRCSFVFS